MDQKIILGDAYKLIKDVPSGSVDFVFTDPPYLFDGINFVGWKGAKGDVDIPTLKKGMDNATMLSEFVRVLKKRGGCALWCNKTQIPGYLDFFKGWKFEVFVWIKTNVPSLYGRYFLHDKEYLLVFWRNRALRGTDWDNCHTYWISHLNAWKAEENICHNGDLIEEMAGCFGYSLNDLANLGAEGVDVAIRCYVLPKAINRALEEEEEEQQ